MLTTMSKPSDNNRGAPSASEWESMFAVLSKDLLDLERLANDPDTDPEVAEMAVAQMEPARVVLHDMRISRGFVPGRTARL